MVNLSDISLRTWNRVRITGFAWTLANIPIAPLLHEPPYAAIPMAIAVPVIGSVGSLYYRARLTRNRRELQAAQDAEHQRKAKRDAELHRIAAPDPAPGQCPVCGLADLMELAQTDAFCGDTGGGPLAFTVPYGPVFAHFACAAVVPYEKYYKGTPADLHHRGYHHAWKIGESTCAACGRESRTDVRDTVDPPPDCTCLTCKDARGSTTLTTTSSTFTVEKPDESWRRFADIEKYGSHGKARWACRYCSTSCDASTFAHAEAALRDHAGKCPGGAQSKSAYGDIARLTLYEGPCYWKCHNCPEDGHDRTYADAEKSLRDHAKGCPGRIAKSQVTQALSVGLDAGSITVNGVMVTSPRFGGPESQRLARIKSALAPDEPWPQWLRSAAKSPDPGVREAARALLNRMRGIT